MLKDDAEDRRGDTVAEGGGEHRHLSTFYVQLEQIDARVPELAHQPGQRGGTRYEGRRRPLQIER